jgi:hypothetical protein
MQSLPRLATGKPDRAALAGLIAENKDVESHAPA